MRLERYRELRTMLVTRGYEGEIEWAENVTAPATPEALWREYAWVVINSGMKNQVAEGIWAKVRPWVEAGGSARNVFGHYAKADAITLGWDRRFMRFQSFVSLLHQQRATTAEMVEWCGKLPWIGPTTKWHLAKNLGIDCAKPDRWLVRVAAETGETVEGLCRRLAHESGDRVATVDLVIWRACNLGLWS